MKVILKKLHWVCGLGALCLLSGCVSVPLTFLKGPKPGTAGFYDVNSPASRVATEEVRAKRLSIPEEKFFVYLVNDDTVVIGENSVTPRKPLDDVVRGIAISPESGRKLASYLDKVLSQYEIKEKKTNIYLDFRVYGTNQEKEEVIQVRFQYSANALAKGNDEQPETTSYYLGGMVKQITPQEIKALKTSLDKL